VMGEAAVAKLLGYPEDWMPDQDSWKKPDVGPFQVRTTVYKSGKLVINESDDGKGLDQPFILVCGAAGEYVVHGWILLRHARKPEWYEKAIRDPAFMVPQTAPELVRTIDL